MLAAWLHEKSLAAYVSVFGKRPTSGKPQLGFRAKGRQLLPTVKSEPGGFFPFEATTGGGGGKNSRWRRLAPLLLHAGQVFVA